METNDINLDTEVVPSSVQYPDCDLNLDNDNNKDDDLGFSSDTSHESVDNELQNLLANVTTDNASEMNPQPPNLLDDINNNSAEENDNSTDVSNDEPDQSQNDTENSDNDKWPIDENSGDADGLNDDLGIDLDNLMNNMGSVDDLVQIPNKDPEWTQNFQLIHVNQFHQPTGVNLPDGFDMTTATPLDYFHLYFSNNVLTQ